MFRQPDATSASVSSDFTALYKSYFIIFIIIVIKATLVSVA